jgi:hypothetical protein
MQRNYVQRHPRFERHLALSPNCRPRNLVCPRNLHVGKSAKPVWTTIVGVIADARTESLADAVIPQIYRSVYQRPLKDLAIFLRGQLDESIAIAPVEGLVWKTGMATLVDLRQANERPE